MFSSKDANLNRAHVQYLESRLVGLAHAAKRVDLENANAPQPPSLSEADVADAETFLDEMLLIYPLLGVDAFEDVSRDSGTSTSDVRLVLRGSGANAQGRDTPEGFVVLQGSTARKTEADSIHTYLHEMRKELLEIGVLSETPDGYVLTQDYRFNSPSTAAGVFLGRSANGRTEWTNAETGATLKYIQTTSVGPGPPARVESP